MMAVYSLNEHDHRWLWIAIVGHETGSDFWNQQVTCILFHRHSKQSLSIVPFPCVLQSQGPGVS